MSTCLYRNTQMESELLNKIKASAHNRYGEAVPTDIQKRVAVETQHITDNGHGTQLAIAAAHGYPVGVRGLVGNLLVSHLLGIAALDPLELGLPWEGFLSPDGSRMPEITLNVAPELLNGLRAHLRKILPECDVLFGPGVPSKKTVLVPRQLARTTPTTSICPSPFALTSS